MVARLVWDQDVAGSNPVIPTNARSPFGGLFCVGWDGLDWNLHRYASNPFYDVFGGGGKECRFRVRMMPWASRHSLSVCGSTAESGTTSCHSDQRKVALRAAFFASVADGILIHRYAVPLPLLGEGKDACKF